MFVWFFFLLVVCAFHAEGLIFFQTGVGTNKSSCTWSKMGDFDVCSGSGWSCCCHSWTWASWIKFTSHRSFFSGSKEIVEETSTTWCLGGVSVFKTWQICKNFAPASVLDMILYLSFVKTFPSKTDGCYLTKLGVFPCRAQALLDLISAVALMCRLWSLSQTFQHQTVPWNWEGSKAFKVWHSQPHWHKYQSWSSSGVPETLAAALLP